MPKRSSTATALFDTSNGDTAAPPAPGSPTGALHLWDSLPVFSGKSSNGRPLKRSDEQEAREIIIDASREAEQIRSSAQAEAGALVAAAQEQANAIRREALSDGYSNGLTSAQAEVQADLSAKFNDRCAALRSEVDTLVETILAGRQAMWLGMEEEIASLALDIARKIIKTEVSQNNAVVDAVINDALRRISDRDTVRIIVCPDDVKHVRENRDDLLLAIDGVKNLTIDSDRRIGRGGCVIETVAGSIDAKIETQFEQIEHALKNEARH